ncbi:MAG: hypothetical protein AAF962_15670 [Actinomycetota bacterium]
MRNARTAVAIAVALVIGLVWVSGAGAGTGTAEGVDPVWIVCEASGGEMLPEDNAHSEHEHSCVRGAAQR